VPTLEEVLIRLATAPPSEFTRERNALVARLTKLDQNEAAARVKAVPRPTAPIWVVNRLAREEPKSVKQLITAAMKPGETTRSGTVRTSRAWTPSSRPISAIRSPWIATSPRNHGFPIPSTIRPPLIRRSTIGIGHLLELPGGRPALSRGRFLGVSER
jgi:hypothetical protein